MASQNFVLEGGLVVGSTQVFDSNGNLIGPTSNTVIQSFSTANLAFAQANAAYNAANNVTPQIQPAFNTANLAFNEANSAYVLAQSAFDAANADLSLVAGELSSNIAFISAVNSSQNTLVSLSWGTANAAFIQANTAVGNAAAASSYANSAYNKANTAWSYLQNGSNTATLDSTGQFILPQITQAGLTAGYLTSAGNVGLNANGNLWKFGADGTMNSPYSVQITTHGFQWPDGSYQNTAASPIAYTQGAFNQANTAVNNAAAASSYSNSAFVQSNTATTLAQGAFNEANGAYSLANTTVGVDATQNTNITTAQSTATGAFLQANGAFNFANTVNTYSYAAFAAANAAMTAAQDNTYDQAIYNQANAAFYQANGAYSLANTIVGVNDTQNTNITTAQSTATSAFLQANAAFNKANTGGTGTGITYTASTTTPVGSHVGDQWYNTSNGILYEYLSDGTTNAWFDITSTTIGTVSNTTSLVSITSITYNNGTTQNTAFTGSANTVTNGVYTTDTGTVTNTMLAGSIANAKLSNSSITINSTPVSLGGSIAGIVTTGDTGTVTNTMLAGSIANAKLSNSSVTVNGTSISLGGTGTVTANSSTLTGTSLNSTVVTSSLTSVGTLTNANVAGGATVVTNSSTDKYLNIGTHGQLFDDGNFHIHTSSGSLWLNSLDGGDINLGIQTNSGTSKAVAKNLSLDAGYGSVAPVYGVRAWINCGYVGGSMTTRGSGNLSVSRSANGVYNFAFATAMPDGNYSVTGMAQTPGTNSDCAVNITNGTTPNTAGFSLTVARYGNGNEDTPILHVQVVR